MVKKRFWLGILVMVLAFGMTVVGCEEEPKGTKAELSIGTFNYPGSLYLDLSLPGVVSLGKDTVLWKDGRISGEDVMSWLDISTPDSYTEKGWGDFTGLRIYPVYVIPYIRLGFEISFISQSTPQGESPSPAIVAIKEDATTLSAIKAKTNGVDILELRSSQKSITASLVKRN